MQVLNHFVHLNCKHFFGKAAATRKSLSLLLNTKLFLCDTNTKVWYVTPISGNEKKYSRYENVLECIVTRLT